MLTNIRLRNFKAFKDTGDISIAPLTVLTGPNSSGKSAIIRAMMALRQTVENRDMNTAFVPTGDYVDLGTFEDFAFKHDVQSSVRIEIASRWYSGTDRPEDLVALPNPQWVDMSVSLALAKFPSIDRIYLADSKIVLGPEGLIFDKKSMRGRQLGQSYQTTVKSPFGGSLTTETLASSNIAKFNVVPQVKVPDAAATFGGAKGPKISRTFERRMWAASQARVAGDTASQEFSSLHYVGPLRESPRRMYLSTGETPREVGAAGELGPAVLWSASQSSQLDPEQLSEWCRRMGLAFKVSLAQLSGGFFRIMIEDLHSGVEVSLPDVGVGTSQLLPILIQGLIAPVGATFLLEQPEIHLHPKVQADLADFLIEVTKRDVGVIVETHSEHLINRLQRRIAEETLVPDSVALYYVTPSADGSKIESVRINEYGQIPTAPEGFFEEGFEETFELISAVGKRKAREDRS